MKLDEAEHCYEEDEDPAEVFALFDAGRKRITKRPSTAGSSRLRRSLTTLWRRPSMSRADAAQQIASYLAGPASEGAVADLRDLGVIGFANGLPGITPETMHTLIAGARQKGRSWDDIGRRLGMTAAEAELAYRKLSETHRTGPRADWRRRTGHRRR